MSAIMMQADDGSQWNAREEMRLLDAVEMYGYGNWKDIALHIETKAPESAKEQYIKHYIHGLVGKHTWREELRGFAVDHTQNADRGPRTGLSLHLQGKSSESWVVKTRGGRFRTLLACPLEFY